MRKDNLNSHKINQINIRYNVVHNLEYEKTVPTMTYYTVYKMQPMP